MEDGMANPAISTDGLAIKEPRQRIDSGPFIGPREELTIAAPAG